MVNTRASFRFSLLHLPLTGISKKREVKKPLPSYLNKNQKLKLRPSTTRLLKSTLDGEVKATFL